MLKSKIFKIFKLNSSFQEICWANQIKLFSSDAQDQAILNEFSEKFLGSRKVDFTNKLEFIESKQNAIPIYRLMGLDGKFIDPSLDPKIPKETLIKLYKHMCLLNAMDKLLIDIQRQGRISIYLPNFGEEATQMGSAAGLDKGDLVFGQYREAGVIMFRGFTAQQCMDQCYSDSDDKAKGRQAPVHYGSKELNFVTISSPLATQLPQAAGAAYAFKRAKNGRIVACYFGDGASSEGDTHAGFNFAATLKCPIIFFCRNNGYAISTPSTKQYGGDGIAARGPAYGIPSIRVDGNDVFAMYSATVEARKIAIQGIPVIIEAMTYRVGNHTTSDDSTIYRPPEEVQFWAKNNNPILRLKQNLIYRNWWTEEEDKIYLEMAKKEVYQAYAKSDKQKKPAIENMFSDVYDELTPRLKSEMQELKAHVKKYEIHYPVNNFECFHCFT